MSNGSNVYFIAGHHGIGKTYLLNQLSEEFELLHIDTGPLIRKIYQEQTNGNISIGEWVRNGETKFNGNFTNDVLCHAMEYDINNVKNIPIFITGNRSIEGIHYISSYFGFDGKVKIIYLDAPFTLLKDNYMFREGKSLTDDEFISILGNEIASGLNDIKEYVLNNPSECWYYFKRTNDSQIYESLRSELLKKSDDFKRGACK